MSMLRIVRAVVAVVCVAIFATCSSGAGGPGGAAAGLDDWCAGADGELTASRTACRAVTQAQCENAADPHLVWRWQEASSEYACQWIDGDLAPG